MSDSRCTNNVTSRLLYKQQHIRSFTVYIYQFIVYEKNQSSLKIPTRLVSLSGSCDQKHKQTNSEDIFNTGEHFLGTINNQLIKKISTVINHTEVG